MDYRAFEQRVLDVLFQSNVALTPAHMAYYARVPIAEAEKHLESMVEQRILHKECDLETGAVLYEYPQRALLPARDSQALVPVGPRPMYSPVLAAVLSVVLPGAGHMYSGRERAGVFWMIGTLCGYLALIIPGLILHILCIASAANVPRA